MNIRRSDIIEQICFFFPNNMVIFFKREDIKKIILFSDTSVNVCLNKIDSYDKDFFVGRGIPFFIHGLGDLIVESKDKGKNV